MSIKIIIAVLIIAAVLILLEIYRELHCFKVVTYQVRSGKLKGMKESGRIVFLSDLHNHIYGRENEPLVQKIREISPDLVLVGGDMLVGKKSVPYDNALKTVKEIAKYFPVYYANGNHEQRMKECPEAYDYSYEEYKRELEHAGVCFLENDSRDFIIDECHINITGLEIPRRCYTHFRKEILTVEEIEEGIGKSREDAFEILMAHNPTYAKTYVEWGADLTLSGHLHGGIVRIPGITGVISPAFELFPKYSGDHYREEGKDIIVSKGLGVHTVCIRLFNQAEIVVAELEGI